MTKVPKIEIHASVVFTPEGPKIRVASHFFGACPNISGELACELASQLTIAVNGIARDQINTNEQGGYDGTPAA